MKKTYLVISCVLAVLLVAFVVLSARQRDRLRRANERLTVEVQSLNQRLQAAGPRALWKVYENRPLAFELGYPPEAFSGEAPDVSNVTARNGLKGVALSQSRSGCVLEVYRGPASATVNPFDESGVAPTEARYVASARLAFAGLAYYVGMAVVSHAVDPQRTCVPLFHEILPTVRLIPGAGPHEGAADTGTGIGRLPALDALRSEGFPDPEETLRSDLMGHPELIPFHGVLGGTPGFHDPHSVVLLPGRWVFAAFDDGHVEGRLIAAWAVGLDRKISWRLVTAECPGC